MSPPCCPALVGRFDVLVAAHGEGPLRDAALASGARFVPLRHVRRDLHPVHDLLGVVELVALMRRERPDIVHANSSKAGLLGRIAAALGAGADPDLHGARMGVQGVLRRGVRAVPLGRPADGAAHDGHDLRLRARARGGRRGRGRAARSARW